ncbi:MAG: cation:proton antiporter [Bacteroidetes bacterium]|nr:cation:proton antiporter [Bacteroidota bacterium]
MDLFLIIGGFIIVAVASARLGGLFIKIRLPMITGLLVIGILSGPFILGLVEKDSIKSLNFINEFSLAFIAFAAGAELYVKELRSRFKSIVWMSLGQLVVTFVLGSLVVFYLSDIIPFMKDIDTAGRWAIALLAGIIFVASSPSSAIAVINELRAKGPFTQTAMGVTIVKDVFVIIFFAVCLSFAEVALTGKEVNIGFIVLLIAELCSALLIGYLLGKVMGLLLSIRTIPLIKRGLILLSGYSIYLLSSQIRHLTEEQLGVEVYIEPLLVCIIGSFIVTNYSKYRPEFLNILEKVGPTIYILFFTLTGASISIEFLLDVWDIALIFFAIRLGALIIGSFVGGSFGGDPFSMNKIAWTPYITQAGVSLGLATIIANEFQGWGTDLATIIIAVVVVNQIIGPPIFKWAINYVGESHKKAPAHEFDGIRDAIIFGLENQSVALARQLQAHGWMVKIATVRKNYDEFKADDLDIRPINGISLEEMNRLETSKAEAVVTMLSDDENYKISELVYEHFGNSAVVRLHDRANFEKFHKLNALIVEPSTSIVSLLDHFVRSPVATSLLLGMESDQDTIDLEVLDENLHGLALRDLRIPSDVIILSIQRGGQMLISHGYTRLRLGDQVTVVGSVKSLEDLRLRFEK